MSSRFKRFLLNTFCKNEIEDMCYQYQQTIRRIEIELKEQKRVSEIPKKIFSQCSDYAIIGIEKNKSGEDCYIVKHTYRRDIELYLYAANSLGGRSDFRIFASKNDEEDAMHIDDITGDENIGYGSILMPYLLKEAKKMGIKRITGWLSPVDNDHFDRSQHFYEKHGFTVTFNEDRTEGRIGIEL